MDPFGKIRRTYLFLKNHFVEEKYANHWEIMFCVNLKEEFLIRNLIKAFLCKTIYYYTELTEKN